MELHLAAKFSALWELMHKHELATITVSFDGSGDSGEITDVDYDGSNDRDKFADLDTGLEFKLSEWMPEHPGNRTLNELVHHLASYYINDNNDYDWVNNDGGYGTVVFHADEDPPTVEIEYNIRYTEVNTYTHNYDCHGVETQLPE